MAGSPQFKVYNADGEYRAAFKDASEAAILVAVLGDGTTIRLNHSCAWIVWTEGKDGHAGESYDRVAEVVEQNRERCALRLAKGMVADRRTREVSR